MVKKWTKSTIWTKNKLIKKTLRLFLRIKNKILRQILGSTKRKTFDLKCSFFVKSIKKKVFFLNLTHVFMLIKLNQTLSHEKFSFYDIRIKYYSNEILRWIMDTKSDPDKKKQFYKKISNVFSCIQIVNTFDFMSKSRNWVQNFVKIWSGPNWHFVQFDQNLTKIKLLLIFIFFYPV